MSEHAKAKAKRLNEILDDALAVTTLIETPDAEDAKKFPGDTSDNREKLKSLLTEGEKIRLSIEQDKTILGFKRFLEDPADQNPLGGDGVFSQPLQGEKALG